MRSNATFPIHRPGARIVTLAALAGLSTACVSGGGASPLTGAEAETIVAALAGEWVLDEAGSSPQTDMPPYTRVSTGAGMSPLQSAALYRAAFDVLFERPARLALRMDGARLVYMPSPGDTIEIPTDGKRESRLVNKQIVRTRVFQDDGRLGLEHIVDAWHVREILELVDGRLEMTRTIRVTGVTMSPIVLRYHRAQAK